MTMTIIAQAADTATWLRQVADGIDAGLPRPANIELIGGMTIQMTSGSGAEVDAWAARLDLGDPIREPHIYGLPDDCWRIYGTKRGVTVRVWTALDGAPA